MAQSKSGGNQGSKQSDDTAVQDSGNPRKTSKSSRNNKANVKAGTNKGAGGGAKQKQGR